MVDNLRYQLVKLQQQQQHSSSQSTAANNNNNNGTSAVAAADWAVAVLDGKIQKLTAQIKRNESKLASAHATYQQCEQELQLCNQLVDNSWISYRA